MNFFVLLLPPFSSLFPEENLRKLRKYNFLDVEFNILLNNKFNGGKIWNKNIKKMLK